MPRIGGSLARLGTGAKRRVFAALGLVLLAIGIVGIVLPGIPGTLFLLGASYFFVRSSPRLERWLREHPRLGPYLRLAESGSMPRRAKIGALAAMWTAIVVSILLFGAGSPAGSTLIALGLVGTGVILFRIRTSPAA
jgi:uncharacterized membrane protein YbaN (DUF454 family)